MPSMEEDMAMAQAAQDARFASQARGYTPEELAKIKAWQEKNASRWALPTTGNLSLDDYRRSMKAYMKAARGNITGYEPSTPGTGWGESYSGDVPGQAIYGNQVGDPNLWDWDWASSLSPEQSAEYRRLREAHDQKINSRGKLAAIAALGGIAGIGALGAGLGGLGGLGASEGLGALSGGLEGSLGGVLDLFGGGFGTGLPASVGNLAPGMLGAGELGGALGAGAVGGFDAAAAADMAGGLLPEFGTSAAYSAIPGLEGMATGTLGSSAWNSIPEFLKSLGTSAAKNVGSNWLNKLITGGAAAYTGGKATGQYNDVINQINQLYAPDSPYAKQMQQAMARKDAAAGRNSQYGTRAVELAAALTNSKANALTSQGYGNLMMQRGLAQNQFPASMIALLQSQPGQDLITKAGGGIGNWINGLFGNGGDKITPTTPNAGTGSNWWENWGGYIGGGA